MRTSAPTPPRSPQLAATARGRNLQLHGARARRIRPPARHRARRKDSRRGVCGRHQLVHTQPAVSLGRATALARRSMVVHCGLDAAFHVRRAEHSLRLPSAIDFVCVGQAERAKRPAPPARRDAIRCSIARPHACELVLAGDGDLRSALEARIAALGLHATRANHRLDRQRRSSGGVARGTRPGVAELCRRPARGHHGGRWRCAGTVITTTVAGIPELVQRRRETGWLVAPGDVEALAEAMIDVPGYAATKVLATMGERARDARAEAA